MAAWINEFHYDNAGADSGEFIEIAGAAGTDLSGWALVRYNGTVPTAAVVYTSPGTITLTGVIPDQQNGFGALSFSLPQDGLQNGGNDGFALVDGDGIVVQLLSYEGVFTASGGAADGLTSTDVGVAESGSTPVGASLHLVGSGDAYEDFTWAATTDDSPGAVNAGQTFQAAVVMPVINEFSFSTTGPDVEYVEVKAAANTALSTLYLLQIEGDAGSSAGTVDSVLQVGTTDAAGYWLGNVAANTFENGTVTLLLVSDWSGTVGTDLDADNDGVLDTTPWTAILDSVAVNDGGAGDITYGGAPVLGVAYDGLSFAPGGASRIPDGADTDASADWVRNDFDLAGIPGFTGTPVVGEAINTPGAPNQAYALPTGASITINDAAIAEGNAGTTLLTFTVERSDNSGAFTLDYATSDGTATAGSDYEAASGTLSFTAGGALSQTITVTLNGDTDFEANETFSVTLSNLVNSVGSATLGDAVGAGTIVNDDANLTKIHAVQGAGAASPLVGQTVTVDAIVVGDFQNGDGDASRNLQGFYLQEEDADADADALTSEGIFVFQGASVLGDVNIGDRVQVTGTVSEFFGMTQISAASITVVSAGNALPTAAEILLPAAGTTLSQINDIQPDLEAYEGMRVVFPQVLTVTEQFQLDRFNEIKLVAGDRPVQFTQENAPDAAGYQAALQEVGARTITYDDGLNIQNGPIGTLDGFGPTYATANAPRMGDTVTGLTGVLDYQWAGNAASGATWRVRATEDGANSFETANARPESPPDVGGTLKVASFNVLNFFTTLNANGATTAIGLEPRGANSIEEFLRQAEKLLTTLDLLGADIIGLIELENDFAPGSSGNAIEYIVNGLNALEGDDAWSWVNPDTQFVGTDAIGVGLIYRNDAVQLADGTTVAILDSGLIAEDGRAPIAASFEDLGSGEVFTVTVNHFKSKGSAAGLPGDADLGDGQGFSNATRVQQAQELVDWLATDPTGADDADVLIIGDLNAYAKEDPIALLEAAGYVNLEQPGEYSYVFDGLTGSLDHALASASLAAKVAGAAAWHINADEADALDYNLDFGRDPAIFDGTVPFRTSDHDPLVVGFDFAAAPVAATLTFDIFRTGTPSGDIAGFGGQVTEIAYRDDTTGGVSLTDTRDADAPLAEDGVTISAEDGDFAIHGIAFSDNSGNRRAGADPLLTVTWDESGQEASIELLRTWNSWKNLVVESFDGTALSVDNFVHVVVDLAEAMADLTIALQGTKRADVTTGDGDDAITVGIDSNTGARNLISVDAGAGDDIVRLGAADRAYAAPVFGLSQFDTRAVTEVVLGEGDDLLYGTASDHDMAIYADAREDVSFAAIAGGVRVSTLTEGTDELFDVEFVQLAGIRYALDALV
ncbi:ExeM/NucH family extracellular endonuclease [Roseomonas sp. AR75]|uniref:ExeM/NucH family extracellular endonuclease n=1 Tax=Roseomonas sp. AR75 TaxID=2562311 RepID=UPI00198151A2|nr:ExeM/NucH family extracellular endonuclease [Roseomonas sp. AR75]